MTTLAQRLAGTGKRFYMVSFTVRNGSTMLCDDLRAMDIAEPTEYFQESFYLLDERPVADYVMQVATEWASPWFGFKINWHQATSLIARLQAEGELGPGATIWSLFPGLRSIRLVRDDKVLQAISAWRAATSDVWHVSVGEERQPGQPEYDYDAIKLQLDSILYEECMWDDVYRSLGVRPHDVHYEPYLADRRSTLQRIGAYLGAQVDDPPIEDLMVMLRDDWSQEMARRFRLTARTPDQGYYRVWSRFAAKQREHPMPSPRSVDSR